MGIPVSKEGSIGLPEIEGKSSIDPSSKRDPSGFPNVQGDQTGFPQVQEGVQLSCSCLKGDLVGCPQVQRGPR